MEFHQLRYFVATAEALSVTAAAKKLHVSQPALSRQIRVLEEELEVALFDRIKKRMHLTEAGRFFLKRARQLICDAETSKQLMQENFGGAPPQIRLGFISVFLDDLVIPSIKSLKTHYPDVDISLHELSPRAQLDRLRDGELDLAILGNIDDRDRADFTIKRISRSRMDAVVPEDHRLAKRKQIKLAELSQDPFISLSDAFFPGRRQFLRSVCQSQDFEPLIAVEADSLSLLLGEVSAGNGVAIMPSHSQKMPHAGCRYIPLKTPVVYIEGAAVYRPNSASNAVEQLIATLKEIGSTV